MNKYRIYFGYNAEERSVSSSRDFECSTPIMAINQFHKLLQTKKEMESDRRTVKRPLLRPEDYNIIKIVQRYHNAHLHKDPSQQPIIESIFDLPKGPNPDLAKKAAARQPEPAEFKW